MLKYQLSRDDLGTVFQAGTEVGLGPTTLNEILIHLQTVYCQSIGIKYVYIRELEEFNWIKQLQKIIINQILIKNIVEILKQINSCVGFEKFLHKKYVGQKRFSIEGQNQLSHL